MDLSAILSKIIPFAIAILFFGVIIFVHEFGHFIFAKLFGVKVNEFAIGMGPTIFKKQGKETKYALRLLPFGGFVSMEGEEEESEDKRAFCNQKAYKRMIILAAGAVMNLILGLIVCIFLVSSEQYVGTNTILQFYDGAKSNLTLMEGDRIIEIDGKRVFSDYDISYLISRNPEGVYEFTVVRDGEKLKLENVQFGKRTSGNFNYDKSGVISSVSQNLKDAGLQENDRITAVNGEKVESGEALIAAIGKDEDFTYDFEIVRGEQVLTLKNITLNTVTFFDFVILGEEKNPLNVLSAAFSYALSMGRMVYLSLFDLVRGTYGINDLAGPIGTVSVIADIAQKSIINVDWGSLFMIMAMITINIGLFNLLPIPALDGGHLFFLLFEVIFRKPVPQKYETFIHAAGLVILLGFMLIISASDIWKLISGKGFY